MHGCYYARGEEYLVLLEWQGLPEVHRWGHLEEGQMGLALPDCSGAVP